MTIAFILTALTLAAIASFVINAVRWLWRAFVLIVGIAFIVALAQRFAEAPA